MITGVKYFQMSDTVRDEEHQSRVTVPAWKLEIIKNRKRQQKTSASFSHHDRSRRQVFDQEMSKDADNEDCGSVKTTRDMIQFFNGTLDGSSESERGVKRSLSLGGQWRRGGEAAEAGTNRLYHQAGGEQQQLVLTEQERRDSGMWWSSGGAGRPGLSSELTRKPGTYTDNSETILSQDQDDDILSCWGQDTGHHHHCYLSTSVPEQSPWSAVPADSPVILLSPMYDHHMMGEDTRLYVSNGERGHRVVGGGSGVGARLYRDRRHGGHGHKRAGDGDSDGMMGSGGESDSSEEIHYGPGFVSR